MKENIEAFVRTQCGDPAGGAFWLPSNFDEVVELLTEFSGSFIQENLELKRVAATLKTVLHSMNDADVISHYMNARRIDKCTPLPQPSRLAQKFTGLRDNYGAVLLAYAEKYMDEHPEEFGTIKIESQ